MACRRLLTTAALLAVFSTPALAQTTQPAKPSAPPPAAAAPAKPAVPTATTPMAKPINLNTAAAAELNALPQIGSARAKAKFKNWDDFVARKVIPSNAEAAIKNLVRF